MLLLLQAGQGRPVVGVLGCMAERLKEGLLKRGSGVDLVAGPDAYRDLPRLLGLLQVRPHTAGSGAVLRTESHMCRDLLGRLSVRPPHQLTPQGGCLLCRACLCGLQDPAEGERSAAGVMNVQLSLEETYADIAPVRPAGQTSAFVSIMRGCNNMVRCQAARAALSYDQAETQTSACTAASLPASSSSGPQRHQRHAAPCPCECVRAARLGRGC